MAPRMHPPPHERSILPYRPRVRSLVNFVRVLRSLARYSETPKRARELLRDTNTMAPRMYIPPRMHPPPHEQSILPYRPRVRSLANFVRVLRTLARYSETRKRARELLRDTNTMVRASLWSCQVPTEAQQAGGIGLSREHRHRDMTVADIPCFSFVAPYVVAFLKEFIETGELFDLSNALGLYPGDEWYDYEFSGFNPYDSFCVVYVNPLRVYRPPVTP